MRLRNIVKFLLVILLLSSKSYAVYVNSKHPIYKDRIYKDQVYKDQVEYPPFYTLKDGFYVGAQMGYDNYRVHQLNDVTSIGGGGAPVYSTDLSTNGWLGGLFAGYGQYINDVYYLGGEVFGNVSSNPKTHNVIITNPYSSPASTEYSRFTGRSTFGLGLLPGVKINDTTLAYIRLGYKWASMRYQEWIHIESLGLYNSNSVTQGGFNYGVGIESLLYLNWSMRAEYSHTTYSSFSNYLSSIEVGTDSCVIEPSDNVFTLGLVYHFA